MAKSDDRRAASYNPPKETELTDELRSKLDGIYDEFEQLVTRKDGTEALRLVERTVGPDKVHIAAFHLSGLRTARMRAAAAAKGFQIGV